MSVLKMPKAPAKRLQYFNTTMIATLLDTPFACVWPPCCHMLGAVGSKLKMVKFFMQHLWMLHDVVVVWPGSSNNVTLGMHTNLIFNSQHVATHCNRVANHVAPNNVAICCVQMLQLFGQSLQNNVGPTMLGYVELRCYYRLAGA